MSNSIPNTWKKSNLGEVLSVQGGNAFKSEDFTDSGIPVIRISNIKQGQVDLSSAIYTKESKAFSKFEVAYGDVLVAMSGATTGKIGRFKLAETAYINQRVGRLLLKNDKLTSLDFIYHVGTTDDFLGRLLIDAMGGAQPNISNQSIEALRLDLPTFPEQQKIADILTSVDDVIESTQAQINKLKDLKTGMMQELLTKGIGHNEFKDSPVGRIPKAWEVLNLGQVTIAKGMQTGPFGSQLHSHEYVENGIPVVMPKDMKDQKIVSKTIAKITQEKADELGRHKLIKGDILFSRRGDIGRCVLVKPENEGWVCGTGCLKARLGDRILPEYFIYYLTLTNVVEWLINNSVGQTMLNLNTSILSELPVPVPTLEEQRLIANSMDALINSIDTKERKLEQLNSTKKALMQDLLTGKVRVKVN